MHALRALASAGEGRGKDANASSNSKGRLHCRIDKVSNLPRWMFDSSGGPGDGKAGGKMPKFEITLSIPPVPVAGTADVDASVKPQRASGKGEVAVDGDGDGAGSSAAGAACVTVAWKKGEATMGVPAGVTAAAARAGAPLLLRLDLRLAGGAGGGADAPPLASVSVPMDAVLLQPRVLFDRALALVRGGGGAGKRRERAGAGGGGGVRQQAVGEVELKLQFVPEDGEDGGGGGMGGGAPGAAPFHEDSLSCTEVGGRLVVRVLEAKNLHELAEEQDPYVQLQLAPVPAPPVQGGARQGGGRPCRQYPAPTPA
jgi:hypothetical protein